MQIEIKTDSSYTEPKKFPLFRLIRAKTRENTLGLNIEQAKILENTPSQHKSS